TWFHHHYPHKTCWHKCQKVCASPIGSHDSRLSLQQGTKLLERRTRMTPLWRFMGTKPTGAYCRDHFECSTQICRRGRCALNGAVHS
uniref:Liver-expressed antimicrobial peptide 2-like n=1 Tax=Salmo trutta TaxID=8032 RepID=A0A673YM02_SALTR